MDCGKTENDKKKEYLRQYLLHKREIARIESELEEVRLMKGYPSVKIGDGMPRGSGGNNDLSSYAAQIDELERKLEKERYLRVKAYKDIRKQIDLLEDDTEREVLFYRYIKSMAWWKISEKLELSERHVTRIHGKALNNFKII